MKVIRFVLPILFLLSLLESTHAQNQLSQGKVDKLFNKGIELVDHANYGAARDVLTDFLNTAPQTDTRRGEAEYYVAFSALSLGHSDGEKLIDQFISNNPSDTRAASAYYDLANFFYNDKNYTKAIQYYGKVNFPALSNDNQSEGHFKWGYSYFNLKKLDEAQTQFNFVKKQNNSYSPAANYYAGFVEYSKGQFEEALADLKRAEASKSYADIVPYLVANIYYKQRKYDELIQYAATLKGRDITNPNEISMLVADAYFYKNDYKKAIEAYEKYLSDNPDKAESPILFRAGYANYALGQDAKAITYLNKSAAGKDSISYYASYYLGILYLKKGDKAYALNSFDYSRKYKNDQKLAEESSFQYGKVSYDAGKQDQSIAEFEKFIKSYPASSHTVEVKELLAQAYINGDNFHKAIEYIESLPTKSRHIEQAYQKATYLKGAELFNKEDYEQAITYFDKSLQYPVDPSFVALASYWNGEAYSISKQYDQAIANYTRIVSLKDPVDAEVMVNARYGLGYAYFNQKIYERALFSFKEFANKGSKSTPNYTDGLIRLGDCYYMSKQYEDALSYYNRASAAGSPDNDYVLLQTGVVNGVERRYADCRKQLTSLIQSYPKSQYRDDALFYRANYEIEQGNYQAAADGLSQLIREIPNSPFLPEAYMRRADSYYNLKQFDKTIADYGTVVKQFSTLPLAQKALIPLQEALNAAGRSGEFENYMGEVTKANPGSASLDSLQFETAKNSYFNQQYAKAITNLNTYVNAYPQSGRVPEARYYIAESHYRLKEYDKALVIYNDLNKQVNVTLGNKVLARIAELQFKTGKYDVAVSSFHKLEKLAASKKEQYNAWSGLMESFYLLNQYDSADIYAKLTLEKGSVSAGAANKASLYLGKTALARGDFESAKDEFLNTLNTAQDEYGAEAKYLLAQIFYTKKDYKMCFETLTGLIKDFSTYDIWVGKAFLLIADNFLAQEDVFQAKSTLQSLVDKNFPLQTIRDEAKAKLKKIEQTETDKKKTLEADSIGNN